MDELNRDLSNRYGVPVQFDAKLEALAAIARALDRGDLLHAHIATLQLQIVLGQVSERCGGSPHA
jgi:hypothetical protein